MLLPSIGGVHMIPIFSNIIDCGMRSVLKDVFARLTNDAALLPISP